MSVTSEYKLKKADAYSMAIPMVMGTGIAVWTIISSVMRIIAVLPNKDVRVLGWFDATTATAPLGPDGAPVAVELQRAFVTAPELPAASLSALVIQELALIITVLVVVATLIRLARNVTRGTIFSRSNTALIAIAGYTGIIGFWLVHFMANMVANGAFARISDRTFDNVNITVDFMPLFLAIFVVTLLTTVFTVGERMQRDAEGLI